MLLTSTKNVPSIFKHLAKNANYRYTLIPVLKKCLGLDGRDTPALTISRYSLHRLTLQDIFLFHGLYLAMFKDWMNIWDCLHLIGSPTETYALFQKR